VRQAIPYSLSADGGAAHTGCLGVPRDEATAKRIDPLLSVLESIVLHYAGLLPNGNVAFVQLAYKHEGPHEGPREPKDRHRSFTLWIDMDGHAALERDHGASLAGQLDAETMRALAEARTKAGQFKVDDLTYVGPRECDGDGNPYRGVVDEVESRPAFVLRLVDELIWHSKITEIRSPLIRGCIGLYQDERMRQRVEPLVTLLEQIAARLAETATPKTKPAAATTGITSSIPR
jgi:hypothetical protein